MGDKIVRLKDNKNLLLADEIIEGDKLSLDEYGGLETSELIEYPSELEGGRNYVRIRDYSGEDDYQTIIKTDETMLGQPVYKATKKTNSTPPLGFWDITIKPGETWTASVMINQEQIPTMETSYMAFYTGKYLKSIVATNKTGWQKTILTYTNNTDMDIENVRWNWYPARAANEVTYFALPKLEKGDKATPWTPAPEDIGLSYSNNIQNFTLNVSNDKKILTSELIEGYPFTSPVVDDSLVLWLDGSTGKGKDSAWKDLSEKGNDGQLINFKPNGEYYSGLVDGDFNNWRLYGNAFIDDKGFLHIPDNSSGAESPYVQFSNYTGVWSFAADMFATVANDSGTMYCPSCGISYYDENYNPVKNSEGYTSNGRAKLLPINQWSKFLWNDTHGGENVKYVKVRIAGTYQSNTPYIARRPVFETLPTANTHLSSGWDNTDSGLKFDGIDNYVNWPSDNLALKPSNFTIELCLKFENTGTRHVIFVTWPGYTVELSNKHIAYGLSPPYLISIGTVEYDTMVHIIATYDGQTQRLYINGILDSQKDEVLNYGSNDIRISGIQYNALKGNVKLARLYNRALTDAEVLQNYKSLNCSPLLAKGGV